MTRAERVAELRRRALDFRRRGLPRFATECDRLAAALHQPTRMRPIPGRGAEVIPLRLPELHTPPSAHAGD